MEFPVLVIWMIVSKVASARTFGKMRIEAPFSVVTSAYALAVTTPSATAKAQRPERNAFHFTIRIALLLSSRPNLLPHFTRSRLPPGTVPLSSASHQCSHTYSTTFHIV